MNFFDAKLEKAGDTYQAAGGRRGDAFGGGRPARLWLPEGSLPWT